MAAGIGAAQMDERMTSRVERYSDPAVEASVARIEALSRLMDSLFEIPGTNVRIGVNRSSASCPSSAT